MPALDWAISGDLESGAWAGVWRGEVVWEGRITQFVQEVQSFCQSTIRSDKCKTENCGQVNEIQHDDSGDNTEKEFDVEREPGETESNSWTIDLGTDGTLINYKISSS